MSTNSNSNSNSLTDAWLRLLWSPTINMPGGGNNIGGFNYHPYTTWEAPFSGNQAVELGVYNEVASPGRQLGKLADAVLQLADILEESYPQIKSAECVKTLRELDKHVKAVKGRVEQSAEKRAEKILDDLKTNDPEALKRLLDNYSAN